MKWGVWVWKSKSVEAYRTAGQNTQTKKASGIQVDRILQSSAAKVTCAQNAPAMT